MGAFWFYIFPLIAVTLGGPIWLAVRKKRGVVFFTSQAMTMVGLLVGIGLINNRTFGLVDVPTGAAILTVSALVGFLIAVFLYRREP